MQDVCLRLTTGDRDILNRLSKQLQRIADALEKIVDQKTEEKPE